MESVYLDKIELLFGEYTLSGSDKSWANVRCPFHDEKHASMSINITSGYVIDRHDDARMFWNQLCDKAGWQEHKIHKDAVSNEEIIDIDKSGYSYAPTDIEDLYDNLSNDPSLIEEVSDKRHISRTTLKKFSIGYDPKDKYFTLPYKNSQGHFIMLKKHASNNTAYNKPKSKFDLDSKIQNKFNIFNRDALSNTDTLYVAEGEWDCMKLDELGYNAVSCSNGAASWRNLLPFIGHFEKINIIFDNDATGKYESYKFAYELQAHNIEVKRIILNNLQDGKDICDYFNHNSDSDLETLINATAEFNYKRQDEDLLKLERALNGVKKKADALRLVDDYLKHYTEDKDRLIVLELARKLLDPKWVDTIEEVLSVGIDEMSIPEEEMFFVENGETYQYYVHQQMRLKNKVCNGVIDFKYVTRVKEDLKAGYTGDVFIVDIVPKKGHIIENIKLQPSDFESVSSLVKKIQSKDIQINPVTDRTLKYWPAPWAHDLPLSELTKQVGKSSADPNIFVTDYANYDKDGKLEHSKYITLSRFEGKTSADPLDGNSGNYYLLNKDHFNLTDEEYKSYKEIFFSNLLNLNKPEVMMSLVSWYFAVLYTAEIRKVKKAFPPLFLQAQKSSGKNFLVELLGNIVGTHKSSTVSAQSTSFARLNSMTTTTNLPVTHDEYRVKATRDEENYLGQIRMLFDGNKEARGNKNMTVDYWELISPLVLLGETELQDQAVKDRSVIVNLESRETHQSYTKPAYDAISKNFGEESIQISPMVFSEEIVLRSMRDAHKTEDDFRRIRQELPDEVYNALVSESERFVKKYEILVFGAEKFCQFAKDSKLDLYTNDLLDKFKKGIFKIIDNKSQINSDNKSGIVHVLETIGEMMGNVQFLHPNRDYRMLITPNKKTYLAFRRKIVLDKFTTHARNKGFTGQDTTSVTNELKDLARKPGSYIIDADFRARIDKSTNNPVRCFVVDYELLNKLYHVDLAENIIVTVENDKYELKTNF